MPTRCSNTLRTAVTSSSRSPTASRPPFSTQSTARPRACPTFGCTRCTRCATGRTCTASTAIACATSPTSCRTSPGPCFRAGTIDLVPNNFSEMSAILKEATKDPLVLAAASPPDRHGYFSLGLNADYVSSFIGRARFFLEANQQMPRTFGRNQVHVSQVVGWTEVDYPLVEVAPAAVGRRRPAHRCRSSPNGYPNGATLQVGIGGDPECDPVDTGRPSRSRDPHGADLRRRHGPRRSWCRHRRRQAAESHQDRRHVRAGNPAALRLPRTRTPPSSCGRCGTSTIPA